MPTLIMSTLCQQDIHFGTGNPMEAPRHSPLSTSCLASRRAFRHAHAVDGHQLTTFLAAVRQDFYMIFWSTDMWLSNRNPQWIIVWSFWIILDYHIISTLWTNNYGWFLRFAMRQPWGPSRPVLHFQCRSRWMGGAPRWWHPAMRHTRHTRIAGYVFDHTIKIFAESMLNH